jgi:hypothetical protein
VVSAWITVMGGPRAARHLRAKMTVVETPHAPLTPFGRSASPKSAVKRPAISTSTPPGSESRGAKRDEVFTGGGSFEFRRQLGALTYQKLHSVTLAGEQQPHVRDVLHPPFTV